MEHEIFILNEPISLNAEDEKIGIPDTMVDVYNA